MKVKDMQKKVDACMAEIKKLNMKLEIQKGSKKEQIAAITIEDLKAELERMDKRNEELNAKYQRMV